jgi:hypothetical protein
MFLDEQAVDGGAMHHRILLHGFHLRRIGGALARF